jgi:predicted metal-dependent HD superfamily phosphohydrolase
MNMVLGDDWLTDADIAQIDERTAKETANFNFSLKVDTLLDVVPEYERAYIRHQYEPAFYAQSQRTRFYHNMEHLVRMHDEASKVGWFDENMFDARYLKIAILSHDVVYSPISSGNEEASAHYGAGLTKLIGLPNPAVVYEAILQTNHDVLAHTELGKQLCDLDLEVLSWNESQYQDYATKIRQEYYFVSDTDFRQGRSKFLESMLSRSRIYMTSEFAILEDRARHNLKDELEKLR